MLVERELDKSHAQRVAVFFVTGAEPLVAKRQPSYHGSSAAVAAVTAAAAVAELDPKSVANSNACVRAFQ